MYTFDTVEEKLASLHVPHLQDERFITAHYYVEAADNLGKIAAKVASHQSTAAGVFAEDTLLHRCSAMIANVIYHDATHKKGLISLAFPRELFGATLTSSDILHIVSGAVQNDEARHYIFYLLDIELPNSVIATFPGPAFGPDLFRTNSIKLGTIIKPCSGITTLEYECIVNNLIEHPELLFIKEDENLFPEFTPCPLDQRIKIAARLIRESGRDIIFAPHITAPPRKLLYNLEVVAQAGLKAVMFSETYYGGMFREAREYIQQKNLGLAIYAHNGGIGTKTRSISRVLLDKLSRLDGADLRQTAPSGIGGYLRPLSWQRPLVENTLTEPLGSSRSTICVRAGGLDQGNLLTNLHACRHKFNDYLFLMGSAINSIKNEDGQYDTQIAIQAIREILTLFQAGVNIENPAALHHLAMTEKLSALKQCLQQRYTPAELEMSERALSTS